MTARRFALASELDRLSPAQHDLITDIIPDDGEWTEEQITNHINMVLGTEPERNDVEYYR